MKYFSLFFFFWSGFFLTACAQKSTKTAADFPPVITDPANFNPLTEQEEWVIEEKGTERAFTGLYHDSKEEGTYLCKRCNNPMFRSKDKFNSGTGWPSFDDAIAGAVKEIPDGDGERWEVVCANCGAHLGHVFRGEGFTAKQARHCVNSASLNFVPAVAPQPKQAARKGGVQPIGEYIKGKGYEKYEVATLAGGCFWCTEAAFERIRGVVDVISGYSGGEEAFPTYEQVSNRQTGHAEAIQVYYDPAIVSFATLLEVFFVAHDPTQLNRQGPDVGPQYRSEIFFHREEQQQQAVAYIQQLNDAKKFSRPIVTKLSPYREFWVAEAYHQDYYAHHPENPYVQSVSRPKVEKVEKEFADILKQEYRKGGQK